MKQPIEIVRGTTDAFGLTLTDKETGAPYTLEEGQVLVFAMKIDKLAEDRVLIKKITHAVNGEYYLEFEPADTDHLAPGRYFYDVGLQQGSTVLRNVVKGSTFTILPGAAKLGDGE